MIFHACRRYNNLFDTLARGGVKHRLHQDPFQNGTESACAGFLLQCALCDSDEGIMLDFQLDAVIVEQLCVLLEQGVLRLGQNPDERILVHFVERREDIDDPQWLRKREGDAVDGQLVIRIVRTGKIKMDRCFRRNMEFDGAVTQGKRMGAGRQFAERVNCEGADIKRLTCIAAQSDARRRKRVFDEEIVTKTKTSMRTLPLVPEFKGKLLSLKAQQEEYRRVCGKCYNKKYLDYICVDEMGALISPNYLTSAFPKLLEKNGLRRIRFHDLRHSCASLLLSNGVPMKQIQEWLGHSDFSTTANVYAHLDYNSKLSSADAMVNGLKGALTAIQ